MHDSGDDGRLSVQTVVIGTIVVFVLGLVIGFAMGTGTLLLH